MRADELNGIGFEIRVAMRWGAIILLALLSGCATHRSGETIAEPQGSGPTASALAFDPPAGMKLELPRDIRKPAAFAGYEESSVTYSSLRIYDSQYEHRGFNGDRYERRAIVERATVRYR